MAYEYFKALPLAMHSGMESRNIMARGKLNNAVINSKFHMLPYTMSVHENVTSLAYDYYGAIDWAWLVMFSSGRIDPHHSFSLQDDEIEDLLRKEYGTLDQAKNAILYWTSADGREISNESYELQLTSDPSVALTYQTSVSAYTYFMKLNEDKRKVTLVSRDYAQEIYQELRVKMRESI